MSSCIEQTDARTHTVQVQADHLCVHKSLPAPWTSVHEKHRVDVQQDTVEQPESCYQPLKRSPRLLFWWLRMVHAIVGCLHFRVHAQLDKPQKCCYMIPSKGKPW